MINNRKNISLVWALIMSVIFFIILFIIYGNILIFPNDYMLSSEGEALRSYYVMASQLLNDSSWIEHQGMNYPFGEHLTYCDGQPGNTWIAKVISNIFPELKGWGVGFVNLFTFYSLILGCLLLYFLQREWNVPYIWAGVIAITIMLLSPQVTRMKWQPALGINIYIPLLFYILTKFYKQENKLWKLILFLTTCFSFFVHPYHGLMQCTFILISVLICNYRFQKKIYTIFFQSFLPALNFLIFMGITDTHLNRVSNPDGLIKFSAFPDSVFLSAFSPLKRVYKTIFNIEPQQLFNHFEGWSYIGFSGILFMVFLISYLVKNYSGIKEKLISLPYSLRIIFFSSLILFLVSFSIPFKLVEASKGLLDLVPPLRQFRSLGRFAWFFVFALHLFMGYLFSIAWKANPKGHILGLFLFMFSFSIWEGINIHRFAASDISENILFSPDQSINKFEEKLSSIEGFQIQGIVSIPFFHVGSHRFLNSSPNKTLNEVLPFAFQTNLPVTLSLLSRNSIDESIKSLTFFADDVFKKQIKNHLTDESLLIYYNKQFEISEEEENIINKSNSVYEDHQIQLLIFPSKLLMTNSSQETLNLLTNDRGKYLKNQKLFIDSHYVDKVVKFIPDTLDLKFGKTQLLFDQNLHASNLSNGNYKISFWYNHNLGRTNVKLILDTHNKRSGKLLERNHIIWALKSFNIVGNNMLCEIDYIHNSQHQVYIYFEKQFDQNVDHLVISHGILRPEGSNVFEKREDVWSWNNKLLSVE